MKKEKKETLKSTSSEHIIIDDEDELQYQTQPKNKMIATQSKPLSQTKTIEKDDRKTVKKIEKKKEAKIEDKQTKLSQRKTQSQSKENDSNDSFDLGNNYNNANDINSIETKELTKNDTIEIKPIKKPKDLKELNNESMRKPTFVNINDEQRELLLQTNSYQYYNSVDESVIFQIRQRLLKKLDCSYSNCFYSIKDLSQTSQSTQQNIIYDSEKLSEFLLSCECERNENKNVKSNVYSYKQIITDEYMFEAEKQILLQRGIRINTHKITVAKHSRMKYYPLIIGLRREYLPHRTLENPNEPIILPIKIIKTVKPKYFYFFYNVFEQGNVHDMIAVEVYAK